ncbi:MAG: hypothetical protein AAF389_16785 [Gemmatimonadota bacterium]
MSSALRRLPLAMIALIAMPALTSTAEAQDSQGFIYGRVTTESGTEYQGFLRWGTQEGFWGDLFHSTKEDLPFYRYMERERVDRRRGSGTSVRVLGRNVRVEYSGSHQFIARFGDMASIEPYRRGRTLIVMKNGSEYEVSGGGDTSDPVHVTDAALGEIDVRWDRIRSIDFSAAPRGAEHGATRLYGMVETSEGVFEGFIQWDQDEGMSSDVLDGETDDGDVSIRMGTIESIERLSRRASLVTLRDGREFRLEGSNDVNEDNRGIMVEDERFGRLTVEWGSFDRVTFTDPGTSGPSYSDFRALGDLHGTVMTEGGEQLTGRIAYDLDEGEGWEMLNGDLGQISFDIPMANVAAVEPFGNETQVELTSGEVLVLDGTHDVSDDNSGVLVWEGDDPTYVAWREIQRIVFDR